MYYQVEQVLEQQEPEIEKYYKGRGLLICEAKQGLFALKEYFGSAQKAEFLYWLGICLEQQGILYTTTDPQIVISGLVEGTGRLYVELTIQELYPDTAYACMHLLNRVRAAERLTNSILFKFLKKLKNILKSR